MRNRTSVAEIICLPACVMAFWLAGAVAAEGRPPAERFVKAGGRKGGMCAVLGHDTAGLGRAVSRQGRFFVQCLYTDPEAREKARRALLADGTYGDVTADLWSGKELPYADNLINIVVVDDYPELKAGGLSIDEVGRALAPLGTAWVGDSGGLGADRLRAVRSAGRAAGLEPKEVIRSGGTWVRLVKPWPDEIDQWTHYVHGPDGNPVADDSRVGPPARYQWQCGPLWLQNHDTDSSVMALVTAHGRLFYLLNDAPMSVFGDHSLPERWRLVARDAFNGTLLWKLPVRKWGWRRWKDRWYKYRPGDLPLRIDMRVVASGDRVYATLSYDAPVSQIDAATGEVLQNYDGTRGAREILCCEGTLLVTVDAGERLKLMALDADSGRVKWSTKARYGGTTTEFLRQPEHWGRLDPVLNAATDGEVVCFVDGRDVVCVDFDAGSERWRTRIRAGSGPMWRSRLQDYDDLWVGTMIVHDGVVYHADPAKLVALSAETGEKMWTRDKHDLGWLWFQWKDVFITRGLVWTWEPEPVRKKEYEETGKTRTFNWAPRYLNGYDPRTGELEKQIALDGMFQAPHHHRCYRNKATSRYVIASRRGAEFVDLEGENFSINNWVRGTCHYGMMPANGMLYAPPHPCRCYISEKLKGFNALTARADSGRTDENRAAVGPRLRRGPAFGRADGPAAGPADWPTYRHDGRRSGATGASLPARMEVLWQAEPGGRLSAPVGVGDRVFVASVDAHHVLALDADSGDETWAFAAGGRVDTPPTYFRGKVIFGSADGNVYCLRAADGELVWRFRAAPRARLMGSFGQVESAWPVHGSVLVQDGMAYFAAGRSSHLDGGIYLFGLDAQTGEVLHTARLQGPKRTLEGFVNNFDPPEGCLADILQGDGRQVHMRHLTFDADLSDKRKMGARLQARGGFLDDTYFKRAPWMLENMRNWARLVSYDDECAYMVRMYDSLRCLAPENYFTPGGDGYRLFCLRVDGGKAEERWSVRVPVRVRAMVATDELVVAAGPPDVVPDDDPFAAFDGRLGGVLKVLSAGTGEELAERTLDSPPVFDGMMACNGRLFVATRDGRLLCMGQK